MPARSLLKRLKDVLAGPVEARFGPIDAHREHRRTRAGVPSVQHALEAVRSRWPEDAGSASQDDPSDEAAGRPIFLLAAGWRSGSTLLQRLVLSAEQALIWGEPYDHCDLVRRLADSLRAFGPEYPPGHFIVDEARLAETGTLSEEWVANLYPHPRKVREAHRAFFEALYAAPAADAGFRRWGFKEVRLGADYAAYLAWLFPDARFVFLYRNPYKSYRSFRRFRGWYDRWPDEPVLTAKQFGKTWRRLAGSFHDEHGVPGTLLLRYEDLVRDESVVGDLSAHLGVSIRSDVLGDRIAGAGKGRVKPQPASAPEIRALRRQVEPLASRLGYQP